MLSPEEVAGVMAHELAHVKNYDTLTMAVAATVGGAVSMLAQYLQFGAIFGGNRENQGGGHWIVAIVAAIVAPMAAMLVQMAVSRSREYQADRLGGMICGNPMWLASALRKIEHYARGIPNEQAEAAPGTAHLFIINPLTGQGMDNLFSTHPNTENRIAELERLSAELGPGPSRVPQASRSGPPAAARGPWGGACDRQAAPRSVGVGSGRKRPSGQRRSASLAHGPACNANRAAPAGLAARGLAHTLIAGVLRHGRPLEQLLADPGIQDRFAALDPRDRAFARALAATVLRHQGELEHVLKAFLERPLPREGAGVWPILLAGAAQLICLGTPPHAAVGLAVEAVRRERGGAKFAGLANAILRRVADKGAELLRDADRVALDIPDLAARTLAGGLWPGGGPPHRRSEPEGSAARYLAEVAGRCTGLGGEARRSPAADGLDPPCRAWAHRGPAGLRRRRMVGAGRRCRARCAGGRRGCRARGRRSLRGARRQDRGAGRSWRGCHRGRHFTEAAGAPRRQSAASPAQGGGRCCRCGDVDIGASTFDVVILDAPCTATGTIRRHPDILRLRKAGGHCPHGRDPARAASPMLLAS